MIEGGCDGPGTAVGNRDARDARSRSASDPASGQHDQAPDGPYRRADDNSRKAELDHREPSSWRVDDEAHAQPDERPDHASAGGTSAGPSPDDREAAPTCHQAPDRRPAANRSALVIVHLRGARCGAEAIPPGRAPAAKVSARDATCFA